MNHEERIEELRKRREEMMSKAHKKLMEGERKRHEEDFTGLVRLYQQDFAYPASMKGLPDYVPIRTFEMKYGTRNAKSVAQYLGITGLDFAEEASHARAGSPPRSQVIGHYRVHLGRDGHGQRRDMAGGGGGGAGGM